MNTLTVEKIPPGVYEDGYLFTVNQHSLKVIIWQGLPYFSASYFAEKEYDKVILVDKEFYLTIDEALKVADDDFAWDVIRWLNKKLGYEESFANH